MDYKWLPEKNGFWRAFIQWGFFLWVLFLGFQFALFVRHFETGGASPFHPRPAGVEGFLPIGALASLKHWLLSGAFNPVHPAALALFLTIVGMSLVVKKSFCSWLCPVGTLSEGLWKLGQRLFGRNFRIWKWLDILLRGIKYLLLIFFIKIILLDMPAQALEAFLSTPYWAVSDVKMLHFFTRMSAVTLGVIGILAGLSLLYRNFWCRYLCPYGALLGLVSMAGPLKVRRDSERCTGCRQCTRSCPSLLPVHQKEVMRSPECTGCLTCVESCPERKVLRMGFPLGFGPLPAWVIPVLVVALFASGVGLGMATGNWHSSLTYEDYQRLVPIAPVLTH